MCQTIEIIKPAIKRKRVAWASNVIQKPFVPVKLVAMINDVLHSPDAVSEDLEFP